MISDQLPLLDIFNSLRQRHGLPLGVDEYLVVVRSLQAGFGVGSRQELEQLCCLVWAKSEDESRLIQRLFKEMWKPVSPSSTEKKSEISSPEKSTTELEESASVALEVDEPVQVVQAVRRSRRNVETLHATSLQRLRHILLTEYFPVTKRQMKQSWRYFLGMDK